MVLGMAVLNQLTTIGVIDEGVVKCRFKVRSDPLKTPLEYMIQIKEVLNQHRMELKQVQKMVVASVVPPITRIMKELGENTLRLPTLIVAPGVKTGLSLKLDNPREVGADLIVLAVGALAAYRPPLMVVNCDTATTLSLINLQGEFIGALIAPGIYISLSCLIEKTALLPEVALESPREIIGKNTEEALKAGFVYGFSGMVDSLIVRVQETLSPKATVVASGDCLRVIAPHLQKVDFIDEDLSLKGLYKISQLNFV